MGLALLSPEEAPISVATAVGKHQAQRQEHQHAEQELLVGQGDEVPALLIEIGESGNAQKGPHGSRLLWWHRSVGSCFLTWKVLVIRGSPQNMGPKSQTPVNTSTDVE